MTEIPHSIEAEQAVLGAVLIAPERMAILGPRLCGADFYRTAHLTIWIAMTDLWTATESVTLIGLKDELSRQGKLEDVGGPAYLARLTDGVPRSTDAESYADVILAHADRRRLQAVCRQGAEQAVRDDPAELAQRLVEQVREAVTGGALHQRAVTLRESLDVVMDELHSPPTVITTGVAPLDRLGAAFRPGELTLLSGRPSSGKTALALHMALAAAEAKEQVWFASLEMRHASLAQRMVASVGAVDFGKIRGGSRNLNPSEFGRLKEARERLSELSLHIDDSPGLGLDQLRRMAVGQRGLLVVDYLQLLRVPPASRAYGSRVLEVGALSRGLKALAHDTGVSVLALSQLSRAVESRGHGGEPLLSDLRDSGELEQDADVVLMVWRPHTVDESEPADLAHVKVAKNRNGPIGTAHLSFDGSLQQFSERELSDLAPKDKAVRDARRRW
jgi:replicative DNA helicase